MRVWTVSEKKAGTLTQCLGVALHLDPEPLTHTITRLPKWRRDFFPPYRAKGGPEPDLVISCGRYAERHVQVIRKAYGGRPMTVHLQPPAGECAGVYDVAYVSRHDRDRLRLDGTTYFEMIGVPHCVTRSLLDAGRAPARSRYGGSPDDVVVTVLVGGSNGAYDFDSATIAHLLLAITRLAEAGGRVLVSSSRRTDPALLSSLLSLNDERILVWDRTGTNPYQDFLAAADAFVITKDSVTMHCEALASGKPVHSFDLARVPGAKLDKFEWMHRDLSQTLGVTRPFQGTIEPYAYDMPDQAAAIAARLAGMVTARGATRTDHA